jgi:hypothetical protein
MSMMKVLAHWRAAPVKGSQGKRSLLSPRREPGLMLGFFHHLPLPSLIVSSWKIEKIL